MDNLEFDAFIQPKFDNLLLNHFGKELFERKGSSGLKYFAYLSKKNKPFIDSDYSYNGNLEFIHFTSLPALFSIINDRKIRFYNLHNSNDPNEYKFIANVLYGNNEKEIDFRKHYIYTFSFSPINEINNSYLWNEYGNNFAGVAIAFKIRNDPVDWINFHMSEVKYTLNENINNFSIEKKNIENEFNVEFDVDLSRLMGFHKDLDWSNEKEIRLLTYFPYQTFQEYVKFSKIEYKINEQGNRFVEFIELPLWVDDSSPYIKDENNPNADKRLNFDETYFKTHPQIQITNIYWGENLNINWRELCVLSQKMNEIILQNFGYSINVSSTSIKKQDISPAP